MKKRKWYVLLMAVLLVAALMSGCAAKESTAGRADNSAAMAPSEAAQDAGLSSATQGTAAGMPANQKLIRTIYLNAETEEMDALLAGVEERIAQLGGYIENRNVYNGKTAYKDSRRATLTIRIPADKADQFITQVSEASNIISHTENTKDVTLSYVATESRIKALETEQARLLELLAVAGDLEDLLVLEKRLTEVRTELEEYISQKNLYDNQISYATINLSVEEVVEYTQVKEPEPEPTFWQRLSGGFVDSVKMVWELSKDLVIFLVSAIPFLILPAAVLTVIILIHRHKHKKKK